MVTTRRSAAPRAASPPRRRTAAKAKTSKRASRSPARKGSVKAPAKRTRSRADDTTRSTPRSTASASSSSPARRRRSPAKSTPTKASPAKTRATSPARSRTKTPAKAKATGPKAKATGPKAKATGPKAKAKATTTPRDLSPLAEAVRSPRRAATRHIARSRVGAARGAVVAEEEQWADRRQVGAVKWPWVVVYVVAHAVALYWLVAKATLVGRAAVAAGMPQQWPAELAKVDWLSEPWVRTLVLSYTMYWTSGLGMVMGYHRLWAHRSFEAPRWLQVLLAICGTGACVGSARWWASLHRLHHRFLNTSQDPINPAGSSLWYAHVGWLVREQTIDRSVYTEDLDNDWLLRLQQQLYTPLALLYNLVLPAYLVQLWGDDWWNGLIVCGCLRTCLSFHASLLMNSWAHHFGPQKFSEQNSSRDNFLISLLHFGEGYQNFHHEFPSDYRNGARYYQFDPAKWILWTLSRVGVVSDLHATPQELVLMARLQMKQDKLDSIRQRLQWGPEPDRLPEWSWDEIDRRVQRGDVLVVIDDIVHDVKEFVDEHPGGDWRIMSRVGKDATHEFNGGIYRHSKSARNILAKMRVASVAPSS